MTKYVSFEFSLVSFYTFFCPIKIDLSGNTVWPQSSVFQNLQIGHFCRFLWAGADFVFEREHVMNAFLIILKIEVNFEIEFLGQKKNRVESQVRV